MRGPATAAPLRTQRGCMSSSSARAVNRVAVVGLGAMGSRVARRVLVGGDAELFERMRPLFTVLGTPLLVGRLGSGAAAKLVANGALFAVLALLGEGLALGRALGLSRKAAYSILRETPLASQVDR